MCVCVCVCVCVFAFLKTDIFHKVWVECKFVEAKIYITSFSAFLRCFELCSMAQQIIPWNEPVMSAIEDMM